MEKDADLSLLSFYTDTPSGFGRILRNEKGRAKKIVEEKDCSASEREIKEVNASIYLAEASFLREAISSLSTDNAQNEYYLTDIVACASDKGMEVVAHADQDADSLKGANTRAELSELEAVRRKEIAKNHMLNGVSFEDPERAYVDEDVEIGEDSFIGSGTRLKGKTKLGKSVQIEGDSLILDSSIGDTSVSYTHLTLPTMIGV